MNLLTLCVISIGKKQVDDILRIHVHVSQKVLAPRPDACSDDGICSPRSRTDRQKPRDLFKEAQYRGHFWNVLISFQRRTPYKKISENTEI